VSPDGRYFISPLRIKGSALESIFSVLKHTSGGNLSAIVYSPALGRLISRKSLSLTKNKNSEKGYRDQSLTDSQFQPGARFPMQTGICASLFSHSILPSPQ